MATRITAGHLKLPLERQRDDAEFVANLHHGGPDVVEELNFGDGLQAADGHADGAADDAGFGERRVEDAVGAVFALQAGGGFEDAALPFYVLEIFFAAGVGDVFAEDGDALVAAPFRRRAWRRPFRPWSLARREVAAARSNAARSGIDVGRIDVDENRIDRRAARRRGLRRRLRGLRDRLRLRALRFLFGRADLRGRGTAKISRAGRDALLLRALRRSCRAFRRRRASASKGA